MPNHEELLDAALLAFAKGKSAEAAAIRALREADPDGPHGRALEAVHLLWSGNLEEAQRAATGERPPERAARAEVLSFAGDSATALELIEEVLAEAPDDPVVLRCATSVLGLGDPGRALAVARHRVALRPHDPGAHGAVGTALIQTGSAEELDRLVADPPPAFAGTAGLAHLKAQLAMRRHDLPAAEAHAREAVALGPDLGMPWSTLADVLKFQGRKEEAERAARFALEINPRNPIPLRVLASVARARGDARAEAEWSRKADEAIPALRFMKGLQEANELVRQKKAPEAITLLEGMRDAPGSARLAARAIRINLLLGSVRDDALLAREIADLEAEDVQRDLLLRSLAERERRVGRLDVARGHLEALWAEGNRGVAGPLVTVLHEMGDLDAARALADEATADLPGTPAEAAGLVMALDQAGLREEARSVLATAERRYPESQILALVRVGALAQDKNVPMMLHAMRGLDAEHRIRFRVRLSFPKLVRSLFRRWVKKRKRS